MDAQQLQGRSSLPGHGFAGQSVAVCGQQVQLVSVSVTFVGSSPWCLLPPRLTPASRSEHSAQAHPMGLRSSAGRQHAHRVCMQQSLGLGLRPRVCRSLLPAARGRVSHSVCSKGKERDESTSAQPNLAARASSSSPELAALPILTAPQTGSGIPLSCHMQLVCPGL